MICVPLHFPGEDEGPQGSSHCFHWFYTLLDLELNGDTQAPHAGKEFADFQNNIFGSSHDIQKADLSRKEESGPLPLIHTPLQTTHEMQAQEERQSQKAL